VNGKTTPQARKEFEINIQTYYRWRKEYGGLKLDTAKRLEVRSVLEQYNRRDVKPMLCLRWIVGTYEKSHLGFPNLAHAKGMKLLFLPVRLWCEMLQFER
jgi:hypothetical protein